MKPLFSTLLLALATVMMAACGSKEDPVGPVDPTVAVTGVSLNQTSATLEIGGSVTLTATVSPSNATDKTVSWTTSNTSVATVSGGLVKAVAEGSATITATAGGKSAKCTVTVKRKAVEVTGVSLNKADITLYIGDKYTLEATVTPSNAADKTVVWSTSNAGVASVVNGVVTAVAEGSATITATAGSKSAKCEVTVRRKVVDVTGVRLNKVALTLAPGGTFQLEATVSPSDATDKTVTWTSTDPTVVTVENGLVTAVRPGDAIIEAVAGAFRAQCAVQVQLPGSNEDYGYEDL